jgi:hypothetical protein
MRHKTILAAAAFASVLAAAPALAQDADVCLRLMDVRSTLVHDSSTLVMTDRQRNQYTVHMNGTCTGLNTNAQPLTFRPLSEMSCLRRGDPVGYSMPGEPLNYSLRGGGVGMTCFIGSIEEGAPPEEGAAS